MPISDHDVASITEIQLNNRRMVLRNKIEHVEVSLVEEFALPNSIERDQNVAALQDQLMRLKTEYSIIESQLAMIKRALENDASTLLTLILVDLTGLDSFKAAFDQNQDITSFADALKALALSDPEKTEILDLIMDHFAKGNTNLLDRREVILNLNPDEIPAILKLQLESLNRNDESAPNESLNSLAQKILLTSEGVDLFDVCSGQGHFLRSAYNQSNDLWLYGQEINPFNYLVSKYRLYKTGSKQYSIRLGDVLKDPQFLENGQLQTFDRVYSNFPFLMKVDYEKIDEVIRQWKNYPMFFNNRNTADWLFIGLVLNLLKASGRAVVIMSNGPLSKATDREIRRQLVDDGRIEAVIKLPDNMFSYTRISTVMMVLSSQNDSIKMIDASKMSVVGRRFKEFSDDQIDQIHECIYSNAESDLCHIATRDQIADSEYNLDPYNYFVTDKINIPNPAKLVDVTKNIFRGIQIPADQLDQMIIPQQISTSPYKILNASDIDNNQISSNLPLAYVEQSKRYDRYCIEDGDIVITAKGSKNKLAVARVNPDEKIIATGNLVVIRLDQERINPTYLKAFLDSETGQKLLQSIQTGNITATITPGQLENLDIALLDLEVQNKVAQHYQAKSEIITMTRKKLKQLESELESLFDLITQEV